MDFEDFVNEKKALDEMLRDAEISEKLSEMALETVKMSLGSQRELRIAFIGILSSGIAKLMKRFVESEDPEDLKPLKTALEVEKMLRDEYL